MPERDGSQPPVTPEPDDIITGLAAELGLNLRKRPAWKEEYPETLLFGEEAPTPYGRYLAGACLEEIYNLSLRHTLPGASPGPHGPPSLLSPRDVRLLYRQYHQLVEEAWEASDLPTPFPNFTVTHLLGATKRQIAHLEELKRFHESDIFDPALHTYQTISFVVERAIIDDDTDLQYLGESGEQPL